EPPQRHRAARPPVVWTRLPAGSYTSTSPSTTYGPLGRQGILTAIDVLLLSRVEWRPRYHDSDDTGRDCAPVRDLADGGAAFGARRRGAGGDHLGGSARRRTARLRAGGRACAQEVPRPRAPGGRRPRSRAVGRVVRNAVAPHPRQPRPAHRRTRPAGTASA